MKVDVRQTAEKRSSAHDVWPAHVLCEINVSEVGAIPGSTPNELTAAAADTIKAKRRQQKSSLAVLI